MRQPARVPYAVVQDIATSWPQYQQHAVRLLDPVPGGLILHLAGPTDEGVRTIAVWDDVGAFERFQAERVRPALAAVGGPSRPEPTTRDLHARHLVAGMREQDGDGAATAPPTRERSST
jgi:hypothetical protein